MGTMLERLARLCLLDRCDARTLLPFLPYDARNGTGTPSPLSVGASRFRPCFLFYYQVGKVRGLKDAQSGSFLQTHGEYDYHFEYDLAGMI